MSDHLRRLLIGSAIVLLVLTSVWLMVWGVDLAHSHLEATRLTNPVHGTLYHLAGSWFAVLATLVLLRRPAVALLPLRAILGLLLMQLGWTTDFSVAVGVGAAVIVHSLVCLLWRIPAGNRGRSHKEAPTPRWRVAAYAGFLVVAQVLLFIPFPAVEAGFTTGLLVLGFMGLLTGFFATLAWHPDPRRKRLLSGVAALYRKRGAARLFALRLFQAGAAFMLLALIAWWWRKGGEAGQPADGQFPIWTLLSVTAAAGITAGVPVVSRFHPGERVRKGRRRHRIRPLVVDTPRQEQ